MTILTVFLRGCPTGSNPARPAINDPSAPTVGDPASRQRAGSSLLLFLITIPSSHGLPPLGIFYSLFGASLLNPAFRKSLSRPIASLARTQEMTVLDTPKREQGLSWRFSGGSDLTLAAKLSYSSSEFPLVQVRTVPAICVQAGADDRGPATSGEPESNKIKLESLASCGDASGEECVEIEWQLKPEKTDGNNPVRH